MQTVMAESVALILGTSTENRLAIKKKVKKLYLLRSQIAHGKMNYVGNCDLETQRYFSYSTIKFIFSKKTEFNNQKDITNYIENLKFTLPDDIESTHVTETRGNDV